MSANKDCCRFCATPLKHTFADLGMSPVSNAYVKTENANDMERFYPLHAYVCESCFLVQLGEFQSPEEIFSDYAYFSSYSDSWLVHAKKYAEKMVDKDGNVFTAHTINKVPVIITKKEIEIRDGGTLADVAPTMLEFLKIEQPSEMTGLSLIKK